MNLRRVGGRYYTNYKRFKRLRPISREAGKGRGGPTYPTALIWDNANLTWDNLNATWDDIA